MTILLKDLVHFTDHESLPGTANPPEAIRRLSQTGTEPYASPPVEPVIVTFEEGMALF